MNEITGTVIGRGNVRASEGQKLEVIFDEKCLNFADSIIFAGTNGFVGYPDAKLYCEISDAIDAGKVCDAEVTDDGNEGTYGVTVRIY